MNYHEACAAFALDKAAHEARGVIFPHVKAYIPDGFRHNHQLAMDAIPSLSTDPNSAVPAMLTTFIDPQVYKILFSPNKIAKIFGEQKKGTWLDETTMFPTAEHTGEVSSYGDFNENGHAGVNTAWPQRQQYLYQVTIEYGERETERAGLARINWVAEQEGAAATVMNKFENLTYAFGVQGLQNYGLLNDPGLSAPIAPALKAYGGTAWIVNGEIKATANEIFSDIQSMVVQLVAQSGGLIEEEDAMTLAMSPQSKVALTATNSFGISVNTLLKENFPNIKIETAIQYGQRSSSNPQGVVAGNLVQLIAGSVEGQNTGYCSFGEKMRAHKLIPATSSYKQKMSGGSWGAVVRQPFGISQLLGV